MLFCFISRFLSTVCSELVSTKISLEHLAEKFADRNKTRHSDLRFPRIFHPFFAYSLKRNLLNETKLNAPEHYLNI